MASGGAATPGRRPRGLGERASASSPSSPSSPAGPPMPPMPPMPPSPARRAGPGIPGSEQVEGYHAVRQLLAARRRRARALWVDARLASSGPLRDLVLLGRGQRVPVELKAPRELEAAARTSAPQGVIAWADPLAPVLLEGVLTGFTKDGRQGAGLLVVLDGVTDPGNLGSVMRSAACAGARGVVVGRHRSAALSPAALKAAAGSAEELPLVRVPGIPAALGAIREAGIWVVGLSPEGPEELWTTPLLDEPVALVLGSEGRGLSRLSRERCDALVRIPMPGPAEAPGSLNVATACAVACFEVARRRSMAVPALPST
jgi:23S rRNA (guanosine2251-2'-O)-methyltransferase